MSKTLKRYGFVFAILVVSSFLVHGDEETSKATQAEPASQKILGNWEGKLVMDEKSVQQFLNENQVSKERLAILQKRVESAKFYFSFEKGGTGKSGVASDGQVSIDPNKWKIEKEQGNQAIISVTEKTGLTGKLDVTFQKDGTIQGNLIPPKQHQGKLPSLTITLKKIKKLPEEAETKPPDNPEEANETSRPE